MYIIKHVIVYVMTEVKGNKDVKARCGCVVVVVAGECSA
jgi:hypothetical protein